MMQVSKRIPFEDPMILNGVRGAYILSNVIIAVIYFYIQLQINKRKGTLQSQIRHTGTDILPGGLD